jgi:lipopolysaccharide export system protein LptA
LDWDRKDEVVTTEDAVNIKRDNMTITATGAKGHPNLKQVALEKDVRLDIEQVQKQEAQGAASAKEKITITCEGPVEIDYEKNIAVFNNNVKVVRQESEISSDKMDVYFTPSNSEAKGSTEFMGSKIDKIIAKGNVKISRGENVSYSEEAVYTTLDKKIVLTGRPRLIIYSTEDVKDAFIGN